MKPEVNKELCISCGTCVSLCSEVFRFNDDRKSEVIEDANFTKNKDCIEQAVTSCPARAITVN